MKRVTVTEATRAAFLMAVGVLWLNGQDTLDVTFRYIERPGENFVRVFVPGEMPEESSLHWGPNSNGFINPSAPSIMTHDKTVDAYLRSYPLHVGDTYPYKFHFHYNESGTDWEWIQDPLNPETESQSGFNNSVVTVTDPLFFQPARHLDDGGLVEALSVGIFTTKEVQSLTYVVGNDTLDGLDSLRTNGVFYASIVPPRSLLEAYNITVTINDEEYVVFDQPALTVVEEPRPSGTRLGPNMSDGKVTFVIHAPAQPVVQLLIALRGGGPTVADTVVMKKASGEEGVWWVTLDLSRGHYFYQYLLIDGERVGDPLARRVRIGRTVFEVGPGGVSTADDYVWQSEGYVRPALNSLVIYELHVDDFAARGNSRGRFRHIVERLDYLRSVGINAIELMPITEFPGNRSWGYNPQYHAAVEQTYGTPAQFKALVDEAHLRGIAVILDVVFNHMDGTSPLWKIQPSVELNPYFKSESDLRPNETHGSFGGRDMDHFTDEVQDYVDEILRIWVEEYRIDGFRFDYTRGIGWSSSQPEYGILGWSSALKETAPAVYQIAEHLAADPNLIKGSDLDAGWHDSFHDRLLEDIWSPKPTPLTVMRQVVGLFEYSNSGESNRYDERTQAVNATVTHDEQSLIQEMVAFKGISLDTALIRDLFYSTFTFTSLGIPMIWQGQELGMQSGWFDLNGNGNWDEEKLSYRPVDWSLENKEGGQRHLDVYRRLIHLRKINPALTRGTLYELDRFYTERSIVYGFLDESPGNQGNAVMVVANLSAEDQTLTDVPWISPGTWYDVFNDDQLTVSDSSVASFPISAYTAKVFSNSPPVDIVQYVDPVPTAFALGQNYPNPFNPRTHIEFSLEERGHTMLVVHDLLGREVKRLVSGVRDPGYHSVAWDGTDQRGRAVASGVYVYTLTTPGQTATRKLALLR